jgi:polyhydroxybutyrate depolymerase
MNRRLGRKRVERPSDTRFTILLLAPLLVSMSDCGTSDNSTSSTPGPSLEGGDALGQSAGPEGGRASTGETDAGAADTTAIGQPDARASNATTPFDSATPEVSPDTSGGYDAVGGVDAGTDGAEGGDAPDVVTCVPGSTLPTGDTNRSIDVSGTTRTYVLHVPSSVTAQTPAPLVVDFHSLMSTGASEESLSSYTAMSDQQGFVIAFPDGIDGAWNIGPCCTMSRSVDDLSFAKALVVDIEKQGCIDPKRVYAVGYSMGGGMSHYLACNAADVFAAVAPAAFDLLVESEEPCHPSRPITVLSFRGTADPIVPYDGGASNPPNGLNVTIHFLGAQGTLQKWAQLDGCTGSPSAEDSNGCSTYSQCQAGVEVTLCTTQGGGHSPGDANIGWPMLEKHPMP